MNLSNDHYYPLELSYRYWVSQTSRPFVVEDQEIVERSPDLLGNSQREEKGTTHNKEQIPSGRSDGGRGKKEKRALGRIFWGNVRGNLFGGQRVCI